MRRLLAIACTVCLCLGTASAAQTRAETQGRYQAWLTGTLWPKAQAQGITRATFDAALAAARINWDLPDLRPSPTQAQAEFRAPGRYFKPNTVNGAARIGRNMAKTHQTALVRATAATGVPGHIILAIWGRESSYGQAKIPHNVFDVLGTKAFLSPRGPYFEAELLAALDLAQRTGRPPDSLRSSWAGALGQPQFMPSNVVRYARDGDGDGVADIWTSQADTIMSIGTYLQQHGWVPGRDWGFEVTVPASVPCALEGPDQGQPIATWVEQGITRVGGKAFPTHEMSGEGYLMMPAGRAGPAFLVTPNFYVLKDYNTSDVYALFVGHVGDKIAYGSPSFSANWGQVDAMGRTEVAAMQRSLEKLGHDVGGADGLVGFKTRRSIGRWQMDQGLAPTCFPDAKVLAALR